MPEPKIYRLPDIGEGGLGEVTEWLIAPGDSFEEEQAALVVEADKATLEVPTPAAGVLEKQLVAIGDEIASGAPLFSYQPTQQEAHEGETEEKPQPADQQSSEPSPASAPASLSPASAPASVPAQTPRLAVAPAHDGQTYAGPAVRRMARRLGVDLRQVPATGRRGRILAEDVEGWVKQRLSQPSGPAQPPPVDTSNLGPHTRVPLSRVQKTIATRMASNWPQVPQVTQHDDAPADALMALRARLKSQSDNALSVSPLHLLIRAIARMARQHEFVRTIYDAASQSALVCEHVDLGIAVDTPKGLMVPVLRDVAAKSLTEMVEETQALVAKARDGKLSPADMRGGSFSISSLGGIGGRGFTPLVSPPQLAILGVGRLQQVPAVGEGGDIVARLVLPLSLSYDHRMVNGAQAGAMLTDLCALLAAPEELAQ